MKILVQYGRKPHPELSKVPVARELATNDADRALLDVSMAPLEAGRPYLAPPNVPAERVAALRKALMDTFKDKEFLDAAVSPCNPDAGNIVRRGGANVAPAVAY